MTTSEYNDNRPQDGQDDREQRRAEQERYDLETVNRFLDLMSRYLHRDFLEPIDSGLVSQIVRIILRDHRTLLDKEGF